VVFVVSAVSTVLYFSYAASLHSRVDGTLVDAAQQAASIGQRIKQSASTRQSSPRFNQPVTVGSVQVQLFPGPVKATQPTRFGSLDGCDVAVAEHQEPAYFASARRGPAVPGLHRSAASRAGRWAGTHQPGRERR
jgi:hypothetical protein